MDDEIMQTMDEALRCGCASPVASQCGSCDSCSSGTFQNMPPCECEDQQLYIVKGMCSQEKIESLLSPTATAPDRWTQLFVPEVLCVPQQKPNIEELISVTSVVEILSQRVVKTPVGWTAPTPPALPTPVPVMNQEGTMLTGKKLIIEGVLRQKVMYTAAVAEQSVHSAHFDVPFSAFIILDKDDPMNLKFKIDACIEDIFISRVNERQIFKNITLFIKATPLVCA